MQQQEITIIPITNKADLEKCFNTIKELRPHLTDCNEFANQIIRQQSQGYQLLACMVNDNVVGCTGYRLLETLAWGKILYIDDLITANTHRGNGYGKLLLDHAISYAKFLNCDQVHLDSGHARHDAHRLYLKHGFILSSHHLSLKL